MKKDRSALNKGFVMLEPVLAGALLAIATLVVTSALVSGRQGLAAASERTRALYLAQEGIEALRSLRDISFDSLPAGTWGLTRDGSTWTLVPGSGLSDGYFTRTITIGEPTDDVIDVAVQVAWTNEAERDVTLQSRIANWRE